MPSSGRSTAGSRRWSGGLLLELHKELRLQLGVMVGLVTTGVAAVAALSRLL